MKSMKNTFASEMNTIEKIKRIRIEKGYTQEYMAEKLFIDTVNYGRIERGQSKLTIDRLFKIAEILNVKVEDLLKVKNDEHLTAERILNFEIKILRELKKIKKILTQKNLKL